MNKKAGTDLQRLRHLVTKVVRERMKELCPKPEQVTVGWPIFDEREVWNALSSLIDMRISQGPKVREFEERCARYIGKKYAVAVNSGSSANLIAFAALVASGDVPRGSEVIIPATTFSTVASPILQVGLVPVYVDVDPVSWNIDPNEIKKAIGPKTKVIMPVHTFGNPADMRAIMAIAKKHALIVLEDCCEAHGASIGGKKVGSFGLLSTLSFFVAHNITTGEGGMVFTDDQRYYRTLQSLREFGRLPLAAIQKQRFTYPDPILKNYDARYIFTRLGYNMRMTDIAASLGIEQIQKLDRLNAMRIKTVDTYNRVLKKYEKYLIVPSVARGDIHSYYGYPFVIRKDAPFERIPLISFLEERGIETRPFFGGCLPDQPAFRTEPKRVVGKLPVARWLRDRGIFIGCHPALSGGHIKHLMSAFGAFFKRYR